jgi:hypothetical protein
MCEFPNDQKADMEIPRKDLEYIHDEVIKHMTML